MGSEMCIRDRPRKKLRTGSDWESSDKFGLRTTVRTFAPRRTSDWSRPWCFHWNSKPFGHFRSSNANFGLGREVRTSDWKVRTGDREVRTSDWESSDCRPSPNFCGLVKFGLGKFGLGKFGLRTGVRTLARPRKKLQTGSDWEVRTSGWSPNFGSAQEKTSDRIGLGKFGLRTQS